MRTGLIAKKVGMTRIFDETGRHLPITVLKVDNQVVNVKKDDIHGYNAVQLGSGLKKEKHTSKSLSGYFRKQGVSAKNKLVEFRVSQDNLLSVGQEILASHFKDGQKIDVVGTTIGKGFAGGMKRHNFGGLRASHGVSVSHRAIGSTGQCQDPGKVFKGKKMPGQMGNKRVTAINLEIFSTDDEKGLILVKGCVPGHKNNWLLVRDAVKKPIPEGVVFPAAIKEVEKKASAAVDKKVETKEKS